MSEKRAAEMISQLQKQNEKLKEEKQDLLKQNQIMWNALDDIRVQLDDYKKECYGIVLIISIAKKAMEKVEQIIEEGENE